jgi:hypothetical protein
MTNAIRRSPVLAFGIVAGILIGLAELIGGASPAAALLGAGIAIGYAVLVTVIARRNPTAGVLTGRPVDERWERINLEASAWALGATAVVILGACLVAIAANGDWQPYALMACVVAIAYVGSLVLVQLRY